MKHPRKSLTRFVFRGRVGWRRAFLPRQIELRDAQRAPCPLAKTPDVHTVRDCAPVGRLAVEPPLGVVLELVAPIVLLATSPALRAVSSAPP